MVRKVKSNCFPCMNFRVRSQFEIKIFNGAAHEHNLFHQEPKTWFHMHLTKIELEPAIIWKVVTCPRIISKKYSNSVGRYLSAQYGQAILVSGYIVLTAVSADHNMDGHMDVKYQAAGSQTS